MNRILITAFSALATLVVSQGAASAATSTPEGSLELLPGTAGCVAETGLGGKCGAGTGTDLLYDVVVSSDGKNVYTFGRETIASFARNADGSLSHIGCISATGTFGKCAAVYGLDGPSQNIGLSGQLFISPDGRHVYVWNEMGERLLTFVRQDDGTLKPFSGTGYCIADGDYGGECVAIPLMNATWDLDLSPDGRHFYLASKVNGVVLILRRDASTGRLTQSAVDSERCISPAIAGCKPVAPARILEPVGLDISPDGRHVYIASDGQDPTARDVLAGFDRDAATGELSAIPGAAGCLSASGSGGQCLANPLGNGLADVVVAPNGRHVYTSGTGLVEVDPNSGAIVSGSQMTEGSVGGDGVWSGGDSSFSADMRFVYTEGRAFAVDAAGVLADLDDDPYDDVSQAPFGGFVDDTILSPDGRNVYVTMIAPNYGESRLFVYNVAPASLGLGKLKRRRNGTARLDVAVPGAGELTLVKTKQVKGAAVTATGAGTVQLKVAPGMRAKRALRRHGKARVTLDLQFRLPTGQGTVTSQQVKLTSR